jgi:hypothetical protein
MAKVARDQSSTVNSTPWLTEIEQQASAKTAPGVQNYATVVPKVDGKYGLKHLRPGGVPSPWGIAHEIKWLLEKDLKSVDEGSLWLNQIKIWWGLFTGQLKLHDLKYSDLGALGAVLKGTLKRESAIHDDKYIPDVLQALYFKNRLFAFFHLECGWVVSIDFLKFHATTGQLDVSSFGEAIDSALEAFGASSGAQSAIYNNQKLHLSFLRSLLEIRSTSSLNTNEYPLWLQVLSRYLDKYSAALKAASAARLAAKNTRIWAMVGSHQSKKSEPIHFQCFEPILADNWICESAAIWISKKDAKADPTWQLPDCPLTEEGIRQGIRAKRITIFTKDIPERIEYEITIPETIVNEHFRVEGRDAQVTVFLKPIPLPWVRWSEFELKGPEDDKIFGLAMWPAFRKTGWRYYQVVSDCREILHKTEKDFSVVFLDDRGKRCQIVNEGGTPELAFRIVDGRAELTGVPRYFGYARGLGPVNGWFDIHLDERTSSTKIGTLALDFGTSNSCAYFSPREGGEGFPVNFDDIKVSEIKLLRETVIPKFEQGGISPFLGAARAGTEERIIDPRLFPTELALMKNHAKNIRGYRDVQAISAAHLQANTITDFKNPDWKDPRVDSTPNKVASYFLRQFVAQVFASLNPMQLDKLCLTHPIGFEGEDGPATVLEKDVLKFATSFLGTQIAEENLMTESIAVAVAVKKINGNSANKLVIVLDLGGGTLDVASWVTTSTAQPSEKHPIILDSVKYAGHKLIDFLASSLEPSNIQAALKAVGESEEALKVTDEKIPSLKHLFRVGSTKVIRENIFEAVSTPLKDPNVGGSKSTIEGALSQARKGSGIKESRKVIVDRFFLGIWIYVAKLIESYKSVALTKPAAVEVFCLGNGWKLRDYASGQTQEKREKNLAFPAYLVMPEIKIFWTLPGESEDFSTKLAVAKGASERTSSDSASFENTSFFSGWSIGSIASKGKALKDLSDKNVAKEFVTSCSDTVFDSKTFSADWRLLGKNSKKPFDGSTIPDLFSDGNADDAITLINKVLTRQIDALKSPTRTPRSSDVLRLSPVKIFLEQFWLLKIVPYRKGE